MSETNSSDSDTIILSDSSTTILIESLEAQVDELQIENHTLKKQIQELESRIKVLQEISDSEMVNNIFRYLWFLLFVKNCKKYNF